MPTPLKSDAEARVKGLYYVMQSIEVRSESMLLVLHHAAELACLILVC